MSTSDSSQESFVEAVGLPRAPSDLCAMCQRVVDYAHLDNNFGSRFEHYESWSALKAAAANGCGMCCQFIVGVHETACIKTVEDGSEAIALQRQVGMVIRHYGHKYGLHVPYTKGDLDSKHDADNEKEPICVRSEIEILPTFQQAMEYDSPGPKVNTIDALPLCKRWLEECESSHECCRLRTDNFLPTRLIYTGGSGPQLHLKDQIDSKIKYATLSHSWGLKKPLTLSSSTLDSFQQRIPPEALPKTFLDAIHVSKYLGFQYLWIDSLCIIQDSGEDWGRESSLMTQVYGNSALNIAATSGEDGDVGCFFDRKRSWRCQVRSSDMHHLFDVYRWGWTRPRRDHLETRAWIVQERYLSRRSLHFAEEQIFWECDERPANETYPLEYPTKIDKAHKPYCLRKRPLARESWPGIVQKYAEGNLTKNSDKLIAIGGIAKLVHEQTQDDYIAGMWRKNLDDQLWWHVRAGHLAQRIPQTTAPTWSWASINGCIKFPEDKDFANGGGTRGRMCINVQDIQVSHPSQDQFGDVANATLRLRCDFLHYAVIEDGGDLMFAKIHFDRGTADNVEIHFDCLDTQSETHFIHAYVIPIRKSVAESWTNGLLLEPTGRERGQYRRLGYFRAYECDEFDAASKGANLVSRRSNYQFAAVLTHGTKSQYFIDLV